MDLFSSLSLSPSGIPILGEDEHIITMQASTKLYDGETQSKSYVDGSIYITSHRLLWVDKDRRAAIALLLSFIDTIAEEKGSLFGTPKLVLRYIKLSKSVIGFIKIGFMGGGRDVFLSSLNSSLSAKQWLIDNKKEAKSEEFNTKTAGISGLLDKQKKEIGADEKLAAEAFGDLSSLMEKAGEVVKLAERYALEKSKTTKNKDDDEFDSLVINIGITNPVTKNAAGKHYHSELAREIANFILPHLDRSGGVLALTDIYCLYNRARGTSLISPEDLLQAAYICESLGLPVRLKKFASSGVLALENNNNNSNNCNNNIKKYVLEHEFVTAIDLAKKWKIPLYSALEKVLEAEKKGILCRDDTIGGIKFYYNWFIHKN